MFNYQYWKNDLYTANVNMALEEFFLKHSAETKAATLRLWSVPKDAGVLGYSQDTDVIKKIDTDFNIVRRASGGSHIQIGPNILSYTMTVPRDGSFKNYEDMRAYYAEKIANSLSNLGIEGLSVDNKASTVNVEGRVVASHAIIWGVQSALLHGLIIIDPYDVDKISSRLVLGSRKIGNNTYTEYSALKNIPTVSKLLDKVAKNANDRTEALKEILTKEILSEVSRGKHTNHLVDNKVLTKSYELIQQKYGQDEWTNLKKPAFTKEQIEEIPGEELDGPLKKNLGYCLYIQVKDKDFKKMAEPKA